QTASEALSPKWERLNPVEGIQRIFSARSLAPTIVAALKLAVMMTLSYSQIRTILADSTLYSTASVAGIGKFIADAALGITWRSIFGLIFLAVLDYGYQFWRNSHDLMMTRDEVKEEMKNSEGNPQVKARQRRRRSKTL